MRNKTIHHWITIAICCGLSASSIGICANSLGVFYTPVSTELGVGRGAFALHATISNILTGLFCPISMKLMKKYNFRATVGFGILLAGGATMLMSLGCNVWVYYILGALRGIGCSFFALVTITFIIGNWFEEKHGFAVGLTLCFSGLSGAVFSPLFSQLITLIGWRYTYVVMGVLIITLALPGTLFALKSSPKEKHLLAYGAKTRNIPTLPTKNVPTSKTRLLSMSFIALAIFTILCSSITGIAQHFPGYVESMGCVSTVGATMISAAMLGNIIFKLLIGIMSDKIGPINSCSIMAATNVLSLIMLSVINPSKNYAITLAIAFIYGAIYAVGAVGIPLMTRHVFGVEKYALVYPYISMFTSIGSASSLTIIGLLYDVFGTYQIGINFGIVFGSINLLILLVLKKNIISQNRKILILKEQVL